MCICRLTLAWISSEISTKLLGMSTYLDRSSLTALEPLSCRLVTSAVRCRLATRVTLRQLASSQSLCLTLWLAFASCYRSHRDLESKPFVWFRAKTVKGIVCLADHLHSDTEIFLGLYHFRDTHPRLVVAPTPYMFCEEAPLFLHATRSTYASLPLRKQRSVYFRKNVHIQLYQPCNLCSMSKWSFQSIFNISTTFDLLVVNKDYIFLTSTMLKE